MNNEWSKFIRYLDDGRLEIDNNGAENAIHPFSRRQKNWLFSTSVKGVKSSVNLYSLIETAKANGQNLMLVCDTSMMHRQVQKGLRLSKQHCQGISIKRC